MTDINFYKKIFIFQDLEQEELRRILDLAKPCFFPAGTIILQEKDSGDSM